jgi:hypothetical protein
LWRAEAMKLVSYQHLTKVRAVTLALLKEKGLTLEQAQKLAGAK